MEILVDPRDGPLMPKFRRIRRKLDAQSETVEKPAVVVPPTESASSTSTKAEKRKRDDSDAIVGHSKLNLEARYNIITEIDEKLSNGENPNFSSIAKRYDVSCQTISDLYNRQKDDVMYHFLNGTSPNATRLYKRREDKVDRGVGRAKLNLETRYKIITEIDERISRGEDTNFSAIGKEYGVTCQTISDLYNKQKEIVVSSYLGGTDPNTMKLFKKQKEGNGVGRAKLNLEIRYGIITEIDEMVERGEVPNYSAIGRRFGVCCQSISDLYNKQREIIVDRYLGGADPMTKKVNRKGGVGAAAKEEGKEKDELRPLLSSFIEETHTTQPPVTLSMVFNKANELAEQLNIQDGEEGKKPWKATKKWWNRFADNTMTSVVVPDSEKTVEK